jgi:hypothetical protein
MESEPHRDGAHQDERHDAFRNLCMMYGDFNRSIFLEEILQFVGSAAANSDELATIRAALQKRAKQLAKRKRRGRPRAFESSAWIQKAMSAAFRKRVLGWSWSRVTESVGMKPTKANIRTVQRREQQFAEFVLGALSSLGVWEPAQFGKKFRSGVADSKRYQRAMMGKTGLPFEERPAECEKLVLALAPLATGLKPTAYVKK